MNDDFLYDLRNNPPSEFATRLKAQLERQTVEVQRKQRALRSSALAAMLVGSVALAFVSPTVRQATLTMVMQFRGVESPAPIDPELQRLIEQKDARAAQRIMPDASFDQARPPSEMEWSAASGRAAPDGAAFATRPERSRSKLRLGHAPSLTAAVQRIATNLTRNNPNLDVVLSSVTGGLSTCVRDYPTRVDAWISDSQAATSRVSCLDGARFIEVPFAYEAGASDTASSRDDRHRLPRPLWLYVDESRLASGEISFAVGRLMSVESLDESGLIPLGGDAHREAVRTLSRF